MVILSKKIIIVIVLVLAAVIVVPSTIYIYTSTNNFRYATIVLDAGHGGWDGGVVGSTGVKEADINLSIVMLLKSSLEKKNFNVVLTRTSESALGETKRLDMKARSAIINSSNCDAVISIHTNKFSNKTRRGVQVFYDDTGIGEPFAQIMQSTINTYINKKHTGNSNYSCLPGDFFMTKCALVPSIIIECGFISNKEDEKLLISEDYKKELVSVITKATYSIFALDSV